LRTIDNLLQWFESSSLAISIQQSAWAFPALETVHVIAVALVVGTIFVVDLRLLGLASIGRPITQLCSEILPITWAAFVLAVIAGTLMFISQAMEYFVNYAFRMKFFIIALAGINMLAFQLITYRGVSNWDRGPAIPISGRLAGAISLTCWIGIVFFGRWIGFTNMPD
jgi:hypothetical protein